MNRAERRRAAREGKPVPGEFEGFTGPQEQIELKNPVSHLFAMFVVANATICQRIPKHEGPLCPGNPDGSLADPECCRMVQPDSATGQHLILCGAGPSLADHAAEWCPQGDQVWGCNSAATWLYNQGHQVTHGFTVDQTAHLIEEWASTPPIEYLVATSCDPNLPELLSARGRRFTFFHNYCGITGPEGQKWVEYGICLDCGASIPRPPDEAPGPCDHQRSEMRTETYEDWLYASHYPSTVRAGAGLNAVNRALDVAAFMGFERITILGADCALRVHRPCPPGVVANSPEHLKWLREATVMHADGGHALAASASAMTLSGVIDGRTWVTKPDMAVSAVHLVTQARALGDKVRCIGDTLPNAIWDKPDSFLRRLPNMTIGGKVLGLDAL